MGNLEFQELNDFAYSRFLRTTHKYSYNNEGLIVKEESFTSSSPDTMIKMYHYDIHKNLISLKFNNKSEEIYEYDSTGFKTKQITISNGIQNGISTIRKIDNGNKIVALMQNKYFNRKVVSILDANENVIKSETLDGNKIIYKYEVQYVNKLKKEVTSYEPDGVYKETFFYDKYNRIVKRTLDKIRSENSLQEEFQYMDNGLIKYYKENIYSILNLNIFHYEYLYY